MISLEHELAKIKGIDRRFLSRLNKLEIATVKDLLWHFPNRYEDYSQILKISDLEINQAATVCAQVKKINLRYAWKKRMTIVEAILEDESGQIKAIWFNQPFITKTLYVGCRANFAGKINASHNDLHFANPIYEIIRFQNQSTRHTAALIPIYPETKGLTSKGLRYLIKIIIKNLNKINDFIPQQILHQNNLPEINAALQQIHFPQNLKEAQQAKERFAFADLFLLQLNNLKLRSQLAKEKASTIKFSTDYLDEIKKQIPFNLTKSQNKSLEEILKDISQGHPMNRLLQGDVGSGKTIVAAIAALFAAKNSYQAVFMAPTEVLARQHYKTITALFPKLISEFELNVCLLTGSEASCFYGEGLETKKKKNELANDIKNGTIKIVIGTHAVIQKDIGFNNLALAVVDEQHRFGVKQRAHLANSDWLVSDKKNKTLPHFLSMSATPIPRTLSMTFFGDLDLSIIDELPQGRQPIITKIVAPQDRKKAYDFMRQQIIAGRQVFVICPRIEAGEKDIDKENKQQLLWSNVKAVEEEYGKLSQKIFPDLKIAMLHGRLKSNEKNEIMAAFAENKINILVSTSVVEIGVDIPNATVMAIEGADRFGLAQLYQFRGRVGRGRHQSCCLLFSESSSAIAQQRLRHLIAARNGFELAEKDLAMRGPGQFLGESQTGLPDLAMRSLDNIQLLKKSREAAEKILHEDFELKKYPSLKNHLDQFAKNIHLE